MNNSPVDVDAIISKIAITPNLKGIYDKAVLSGMRIMFDKKSHQAMLDQLEKGGDMAANIADGVVGLTYLLFQQSNKTLPPQIMVPLALTLTLRAFEFLQQSGDPQATPEVLGNAVDQAVHAVLAKFGVAPDQIEQVLGGMKNKIGAQA